MVTKKIPVSTILRGAGEVAAKVGITRQEAIAALKAAYEKLGVEIDLGVGHITTKSDQLDFSGVDLSDLTKTQVLPRGLARP